MVRYKRRCDLFLPDLGTVFAYQWQLYMTWPSSPCSRTGPENCWPELWTHPLHLVYLTQHCSIVLKFVLFCATSCSCIPILLILLKSYLLASTYFPAPAVLAWPLSSLLFPFLHSHCEVTDLHCFWEVALDGLLLAHPQLFHSSGSLHCSWLIMHLSLPWRGFHL